MSVATINVSGSSPLVDSGIITVGAGSLPTVLTTDDADTSYMVSSGNNTGQEAYNHTTMPTASSISEVKMGVKSRAAGGSLSEVWAGWYSATGPTWSYGSKHTCTGSYALYEDVIATAPGGGAWTSTGMNTFGLALKHNTGAVTDYARTTWLYATVTYTPISDAFVCMIFGLGPLLGAAVGLSEIPKLVDWYNRATTGRVLLTPEDVPLIWEAVKTAKHATTFPL